LHQRHLSGQASLIVA